MPAEQQGQIDGKPGAYRLRWYDKDGKRHSKQPFKSKSEARKWYRENVEGETTQAKDVTVAEFIEVFLERHSANVRPRTVASLRERLGHVKRDYGTVPLADFQVMADEVSSWLAKQPRGARYGRTSALRQLLGAAVRWGYITRNPAVEAGRNPLPAPRSIRVFTPAELTKLAAELSPQYQPLPMFAAATGLRPEEWQALERRDIDRRAGVLHVRRTVSSGEVVEAAKTAASIRQVPLSPRALAALDALPPRLDTPLLFPSPSGAVLHLDNFRYREWTPAVEASGVERPARLYDLRSTFASTALAAGVAPFELCKIMGTSMPTLERHYGALLQGSAASIAARLGRFEAGATGEAM